MVAHLNRLKEHYGVVANTKVSKQQLKRIKNDKKAYVAKIQEAIDSNIINDPSAKIEAKREVKQVGFRYIPHPSQPHKEGKTVKVYQTKVTQTKVIKMGNTMTKQLEAIVEAYDQLIKEVQ
tara:strand:- start:66 stop:428 length:363 start_codon:yes stop_codon:yes gene_type:complete